MGAAPKIPSLGSLNDELANQIIRHGVYLQRYSNQQVREIISFLNRDVIPDLKRQLQARLETISSRGFDAGKTTTARLEKMISGLDSIMADGIKEIQSRTTDSLSDLAQHEAGFTAASIENTFPLGFEVAVPSVTQLAALVSTSPMQGAPLKTWFDTLLDSKQAAISRAVRIGIAEGQSTEEIVTRVIGTPSLNYSDGVMQGTRRGIAMVIRTAASHISSVAREATFQANADIVKSVQWVSTLDSSTCPVCAGLDGQTFDVGDGPRPPQHGQCRCSVTPVIKSFKELGIDGQDLSPSTRASFNGQVPETVDYGEWLAKQDAGFQDEALGPTRGKLFRDGGLSIDQFSDNGKTLTLAQLQKLEPGAFEKSGL